MPTPKTYSGEEKEHNAKEFLAERLARGQIKKCSECFVLIGSDYDICGPCVEKRSQEKMAYLNGRKLKNKGYGNGRIK